MSQQTAAAKVHEEFSVQCFNSAWELLEKPDRTPDEDEEMLRRSMASYWHWTQRSDCTDQNLAMAHWQISRIHSVMGRADEARRYAELCLADLDGADVAPFTLAYTYEALARAEAVAGNEAKKLEYLTTAEEALAGIEDAETLQMVRDDLATIP